MVIKKYWDGNVVKNLMVNIKHLVVIAHNTSIEYGY